MEEQAIDQAKQRIIYRTSMSNSSLRQGEILTNVFQYVPIFDNTNSDSSQAADSQAMKFELITHPYAIIITQDCDLDWDYTARTTQQNLHKLLNSVILCEIHTAQSIRNRAELNSKTWSLVKAHRHEQYYFFEKIPEEHDLKGEGLPELTADFKRVFGIDSGALYSQIEHGVVQRRAVLVSPFLEHFSRRYLNFHGRVALPFQYQSEREG